MEKRHGTSAVVCFCRRNREQESGFVLIWLGGRAKADYEGLDLEKRARMRNLLKKLFLASSAGLIAGALVGMV